MFLTSPDATRQDLYDAVVTHLWRQRRRAVQGWHCRYRTEDGLKCAVGCLIPDNLYETCFEVNLTLNQLLSRLRVPHGYALLMKRLQSAHDSAANWDLNGPTVGLVDHLHEIATEFSLNTSVLDHLWPRRRRRH